MRSKKIFDIIGIGIGPFNLGLAALACAIPELDCLFFDQNECFDWHPGLMLDDARLQVPFLADLVTLADPCSPFSYIAFLKAINRLTRFAIQENYYPTRKEYNQYCRWVISQLGSLHFSMKCQDVSFDEKEKIYSIIVHNNKKGVAETFHSKQLVIGTGTIPQIPAFAKKFIQSHGQANPADSTLDDNTQHPLVFHSGEYLNKKELLMKRKRISIIGSGQSAAEIFYDLLKEPGAIEKLDWFTRSARFYPMEYSKLTLEMSSADYINYFFGLADEKKKKVLAGQSQLYKGINFSLINDIYDLLYAKSLNENAKPLVKILTNAELQGMFANGSGAITLSLYHSETERHFECETEAAILATGYKNHIPGFFDDSVKKRINRTTDGNYRLNRNYSVDNNDTIFVQNADLHSHGFNSADLGLGAYRNAVIINQILGKEFFEIEKGISFQQFGIPIEPCR